MTTYRAMLCRRLGPPEGLELAELPRRTLKDGEVRIAVHAAGVNFPDLLQVAGDYQHKPPLPFVPGFEAAGEIIETTSDRWRIGDAVLLRGTGGYAQEMVAPAGTLLPKPAGWSWEEAAAFPVAASTAWVALLWRGRLVAGETLLVLGAGGGTGLAAVALGARTGARVVAVASSAEKRAAAQDAGATECIDPAQDGWEKTVPADVVFDPVGGEMFNTAWRAETRRALVGGRLCQWRHAAPAGQSPAAERSRTDRRARRRTGPARSGRRQGAGSGFARLASRPLFNQLRARSACRGCLSA